MSAPSVSKNYTVIGDTVNLAARLEALNKQYGTRILIAGATEALARDAIETREIDLVAVAGKSEPIRIFELLAARGRPVARGGGAPGPVRGGARGLSRGATGRLRAPASRLRRKGPDGDPPAQVFLARLDQPRGRSAGRGLGRRLAAPRPSSARRRQRCRTLSP